MFKVYKYFFLLFKLKFKIKNGGHWGDRINVKKRVAWSWR
jgi:hypothetical protein